MALKRADQLIVGDVLFDERTITAVQVLSRGDIGVTIDAAAPVRYGPAYLFHMEDATQDWMRIALRRLWNHPNTTVRQACRTVITATRTEAGL